MTIILITGGNRGIGFGICQLVATRLPDATIIIGCRSIDSGKEAAGKLRGLSSQPTVDVVQIDIEDDQSITNAVQAVEQQYGKLDVLINNAAGFSSHRSQDPSERRKATNDLLNNTVTSNAIVTKAFAPLLRKSEYPRVIMNSSARGSLGRTANRELPPVQLVDYCVAKAALNMLTLHLQLSEDDVDEKKRITFWMVSPGHTKTAFNNFRGLKDPVESAEAFVRLLGSARGDITPGSFWEFEDGEFRIVPW